MEEKFCKAEDILKIKGILSSLKNDKEKLEWLEKIEDEIRKTSKRIEIVRI